MMIKGVAAAALFIVTTLGIGAGPALAEDSSPIAEIPDSSALLPDLVVGIDEETLAALLLPAVQAAREAARQATAAGFGGFDLAGFEELIARLAKGAGVIVPVDP